MDSTYSKHYLVLIVKKYREFYEKFKLSVNGLLIRYAGISSMVVLDV